MTTGTEFLAAHAGQSLSQWENAVVDLAKSGGLVDWPLVAVDVSAKSPDGTPHQGTILVETDYLSIGDASDFLRMPLTPLAAQRALDAVGLVLPTPKMVKDIWQASGIKTSPVPLVPNKGANLSQYEEHNAVVDQSIRSMAKLPGVQIISGQKKDVVVGKLMTPGKVVIYGWFRPDGTNIQPRTNVHGDFYVDYSHGIRGVSPKMIVDGQERDVAEVLASKNLSPLLSDEGPIAPSQQRYPVPKTFPVGAQIGPLIASGPGFAGMGVLALAALGGAAYLAWIYRDQLMGRPQRRRLGHDKPRKRAA